MPSAAPSASPAPPATPPPRAGLFRPEAFAAYHSGGRAGAPLSLSSRLIDRTYWLLLLVAAAGAAYVLLARVGDYAQGPAVVRVDGRLDLSTPTGGVVAAVEVKPGDRVEAGRPLVRFHSAAEERELAQLERELELKLVRILLHPGDVVTRQSLAALRAARELAGARLRERQVVAPQAGVVRNLRIRAGQALAPGDTVLTLVDEDRAAYSVVALVPGQFRPMIKRGMPLRFELAGYPQVARALVVEEVADEVVGPQEVRRYLGQELGDTVLVQGSLVLVRARLPERTFDFEGERYLYYDGIPGRADVRVRSMRLIEMMFPALKELTRGR
jgi:multidrug efflux pump subunit AcrA (membrane-fusion protein)